MADIRIKDAAAAGIIGNDYTGWKVAVDKEGEASFQSLLLTEITDRVDTVESDIVTNTQDIADNASDILERPTMAQINEKRGIVVYAAYIFETSANETDTSAKKEHINDRGDSASFVSEVSTLGDRTQLKLNIPLIEDFLFNFTVSATSTPVNEGSARAIKYWYDPDPTGPFLRIIQEDTNSVEQIDRFCIEIKKW
jgi:hypothetical protein